MNIPEPDRFGAMPVARPVPPSTGRQPHTDERYRSPSQGIVELNPSEDTRGDPWTGCYSPLTRYIYTLWREGLALRARYSRAEIGPTLPRPGSRSRAPRDRALIRGERVAASGRAFRRRSDPRAVQAQAALVGARVRHRHELGCPLALRSLPEARVPRLL